MSKFKIIIRSGEYVSATIKAKDKTEAESIACKMDGGDFSPINGSYIWDIESIDEIEG